MFLVGAQFVCVWRLFLGCLAVVVSFVAGCGVGGVLICGFGCLYGWVGLGVG